MINYNLKIKCPYCSDGYVGPLMGGLRDDYCGRRRLCGSCGTIWRMSVRGYSIMIALALILFCTGWWALYHWLRQEAADLCLIIWLMAWLVFFWPLMYKTIWRFRVKKP